MDIHPWTQRLVIRWRSDLRFYEERIAVLRALEGLGLLRAFQVEENQISARLGEGEDELILDSAGLTLRALTPESDTDQLKGTTRTVFEAIRPKRVRPQLALQYLIPVDADYDAYRRETVATFFPTSPHSDLVLTDWALMLTGNPSPSTTLTTEFGIVSQAEIPIRLSRHAGRMPRADDDIRPGRWDAASLPAVAFFCDSVWTLDGELDSDSLTEELSGFWSDAIARGGQFAKALHERVARDHEEHGASLANANEFEPGGGE